MVKLFIFIGTTVGSYLAWWLAEFFGAGLLLAFLISSVGGAIGIYFGWKLAINME
jgi:hypothetical protein